MTSKPCPNCGKNWRPSNELAGWAEGSGSQNLYECRNTSCSVAEYLEHPPDYVPGVSADDE